MSEPLPTLTPEAIARSLAENVYPTTNTTLESQQRYLRKYSLAALVFNYFYYRAMGDKLLAWLSLLASLTIFLLPLLFIFPIWARSRAYKQRTWQSFGEFESAQKKWDEMSLYMSVVILLIFYAFIRLVWPLYQNSLDALTNQTNTTQLDQLKSLTQ